MIDKDNEWPEEGEGSTAATYSSKLKFVGRDSLAALDKSRKLGELLIERGLITSEDLEMALLKQKETKKRLGEVLIEMGYVSEVDILNCLAAQAHVPYLRLNNYEINPEAVKLIPKGIALKYKLIPLDVIATSLLVTIATPLNKDAKEELKKHAKGYKINYFISSQVEIEEKIEKFYS